METKKDRIIGARLASYRTGAKVSQETLADLMCKRGYRWTKMTVYNIERGARQLKLAEAADALACLKYSPEIHLPRLLSLSNDNAYMGEVRRMERLLTLVCALGAEIRNCSRSIEKSLETRRPQTLYSVGPGEQIEPSDDVEKLMRKALLLADEKTLTKELKRGLEGDRYVTQEQAQYEDGNNDAISYTDLLLDEIEYCHNNGRMGW